MSDAPATGWQSMDSAPKDGQRIVVFIPDYPWGNPVVAHWSDYFKEWLALDEQCGGDSRFDPTHWHPLAELPA